jgi:hypothetical protein
MSPFRMACAVIVNVAIIYEYVPRHLYISVCMYVCMCICMYVCMYVYMYICTSQEEPLLDTDIMITLIVCMYVCMYIYIYMYTYIYIHTYIYETLKHEYIYFQCHSRGTEDKISNKTHDKHARRGACTHVSKHRHIKT